MLTINYLTPYTLYQLGVHVKKGGTTGTRLGTKHLNA